MLCIISIAYNNILLIILYYKMVKYRVDDHSVRLGSLIVGCESGSWIYWQSETRMQRPTINYFKYEPHEFD